MPQLEPPMSILKRVTAGAEAGLLAGAGVALFFLIQGAVHLQPLATPLSLASGLLGPETADPGGGTLARVAAGAALGATLLIYTALHFLTFAAVGVGGAFLLDASSFWVSLGKGVAYGSVLCTGLLYGSRWMTDAPVAIDAVGLPTVLLVNAMAGAILGLGLHLAQLDVGEDGAS